MNCRKDDYSYFIRLQSRYCRFSAQFWRKGVLNNIIICLAVLRTHCGVFRERASFVFTKSTHFFLLLIASRWLSPKKGVVWTNIDFLDLLCCCSSQQNIGLAFSLELSRLTSFLRNGLPGRRHRSNSNPFSLNSAVNLNGANFSNFENSQNRAKKL